MKTFQRLFSEAFGIPSADLGMEAMTNGVKAAVLTTFDEYGAKRLTADAAIKQIDKFMRNHARLNVGAPAARAAAEAPSGDFDLTEAASNWTTTAVVEGGGRRFVPPARSAEDRIREWTGRPTDRHMEDADEWKTGR